jgi:hypothetical protein
MTNTLDWLNLIVVVLLAIWSIYQTRLTKSLDAKIHRISVGLDQSLQLLHRIRDDVIEIHTIHVFLLTYNHFGLSADNLFREKYSQYSALMGEIRGIAIAIGDKELLNLVTQQYEFQDKSLVERILHVDELEIRSRSEKLHTRISQLLESAIKIQN